MTNNKQTYDWTKSGSFIKMINNNQKQTQNRLLKGPIARAPKSSRSGYYPDREEAEPIDLTRRYTTEENNAISSYWKKRQEEEKKQEFEQKLNQLKQQNDADKQLDEDYKNSLFGKLDIIAQSPLGNLGLYNKGLKNAFLVKEAIGSFLDNSTQVHGQNITGRIQDEDQAVLEAEAHKYLAEQKLQLQRLIDQRNLHEETNGRDDTYYQFQKQIANLIEKQKNLDPIIQQLDDAYKERYVNEHSNFLERTRRFLGSATAYGEEGRAQYKANVRKQYEAKAKQAYEKEMISSFMDTVDSNLLLNHAQKSADPNMRLLWERANNSLKSGDTNSYNGYVNQIKAKINASPISQKQLYAESNPDYFLDGTTYTPEEKRNLKGLRNDHKKLLDYKITLAKERVLNNNYRQKTASEEYDGSQMDYESQIRQTDEVINRANANKKELAEDYKNTMDWQDTFKKYVGVGKGYKQLEQLHQDDWIINPNYWIYCMPGTIGSSNSSPEGLIGQGIQYGSLIGGPVGAALGSLVSIPFQTKSGFDENYAETAERYLNKSLESINGFDITQKGSDALFKDLQNKAIDTYRKQGMSEEWIAEHCDITNDQGKKNLLADLYNGIISSNDTRLKKVQLDAMRGLTAMREADNMRTMGSMPIEIAAQMIPVDRLLRHFGTIRRAAKDSRVLSNQFLNRVVDNEGRLVATTAGKRASSEITENAIATGERYANGFRKPKPSMIDTALSGSEQGAVLGTLTGTGVVGNAVFGAAGAAARATGKLAYKMLPANQKAFIEATVRAVNGKFMGVYDKLLPMGSFRRSMVKYGLPAIQRLTVNSISEATEEGVQYLNSKKDFSKYGFGGMSLGDLIINDWSQGAEVARSYAALLGIGDSELMNDAEYWNNVKGGFALGGGHAGIIQIANATRDAYRQYKTDNFIIDSSVMNRQADQISRANDKVFAQLVMKGRGDYALETLNDMEAKDRRSNNPQYTQEDYDYKRQQLRTIIAATNNNNIRNVLKAHGIEYGTEKYAAAIADIANTHRGVQENIQQSVELSKAINDFYNGEDYNKAVNEAMNILAANDSFSLAHSVEIMKRALQYSDENLGERKEGETDEQYEERRAQLYNEGKKKAEDEFKAGILARSKDVNRLKALLHLRAQQNTIEDWFKIARDKFNIHTKRPDAAIIRKNINKQIDSLKKRLFKQFAQDFEGIDINKVTDADLLTHLDGMDGVAKVDNLDEIIQLHKAEAMLSADADVLKQHDLRFTKGIVRNKNGEYEYNPAKYQYERDLDKQRREAKRNGTEFTEKPFEESRYGNKVGQKDPYAERIDRILQADYENEQLNWMVEDLYNGDLVNQLIEDDIDDYSEQEIHYGDNDLIDIKQSETPQETTQNVPQKPSDKLNNNEQRERKRKERKRRKEAAKRRWEKRRKEFNRKQRGRMNIDFTLGTFKVIGDIGFRLMKSAAVASYTFQEFVEDMKESLGDDYSAKNMLAALKQYYIRASVKYPEENVSSTDEVISYGTQIESEPKSASTTTLSFKDMLAEANKKIIPEISSFWHTFVNENGVITMYSNLAWSYIRDQFGTEKYLNRVADIKKATETQESFDKYLKENDLEKYSKYRNVNGIEEAIAKELEIQDPELNWAIDIRHSIIQYLTTGQLLYIFDVPQEQIEEYLNKLSEIKKFIDDNNLDLIDTSQMLYGTDKEGNNITCQADVLMVDSEGMVYMWDVVQSYQKVTDNLDNQGKRSPVTNRERNYLNNKSVYDILTNRFGVNIKQIRLLPVQLDLKNHHLHMEKSISVDPGILNSISYHDFNADDINKSREKLIVQVNEAAQRYNEYAERLKSDTRFNEEEYSSIDSAVEADADYRRLQEKLEDILTEYDVLNDKLGDVTNKEYQEALKSSYNYFEYSNDEWYGLNLVNTLSSVCEDLDIALSQFSFVGNITEDEAKQLDYICNKIFDAQRTIDEILHHDIAKTIDISKEQQLVASAMESLYRVYGKSNMNVKYKVGAFSKWWLSDVRKLSSGESTLQYISNKLDNINAAFMQRDSNGRIHLIDDLQNDEQLQMWYSTLLNTYYQEFLNSAQNDILEKYDSNDPLVAQVLEKIGIGNEFIQIFNEQSITQGDETLTVDDINAINVEHQDLYNTTTAVHPSRNFVWKAGPKWSSISNYPDLIEKGKFEFIIDKNGKLFLNVKYADRGGRTFEINLPFEETEIKDADLYNESIKPFINKVKNMLEYKQSHPNSEIKFEVFRNRGSVNYTNQHHNVLDFLLKGFNRKKDGSVYTVDDLYAFCMNQTTRFGVLKITQPIGQGQKYQFGIYTGNNLSMEMGQFDDRYDKQNLQLSSGTIIFNYDTNKPDKNGISRYLKVALGTQQFGQKMAEKIARVLMDVATGNRNDNFSQEALMDMLKTILYIPQGSNKTLSVFNSLRNSIIIDKNKIVIGDPKKDGTTYTPDMMQALVQRLSEMHFQVQGDTINQFFSTWNCHLMNELKTKFKTNPNLQKIELPIGITIERADFEHKNYGVAPGTTLFGYLLRNTIIYTDAQSLSNCELNVDNVVLVDKNATIQKQMIDSVKQEEENVVNRTKSEQQQMEDLLGGLTMTDEQGTEVLRTEEDFIPFKAKVEAYFQKVLGNHGAVDFGKDDGVFLKQFHNKNVLAACGTQLIKMSKYAPEDAMFHEAFHKILELIVPNELRESFYDAYRKEYGWNLSERDVAEGLCDEFVNYINNRNNYRNKGEVWKKIGSFLKFLIKCIGIFNRYGLINGTRIIKVFNKTDAGKYANAEITQDKVNRFKEKFGDFLYYQVKNRETGETAEFENIKNSTDLRETANVLATLILVDAGVLRSKVDLDKIIIDNDTPSRLLSNPTIKQMIQMKMDSSDEFVSGVFNEIFESRHADKVTKGKLNVFIDKGKKNKQREIDIERVHAFDKFNILKPYIAESIQSIITAYDGKFKEYKEDLNDEPVTDETRAMLSNIDKFDRSAFEFSKLDSVTKQVKLFFSTILYHTENPRYTGENGQKKFIPDVTRNRFFLPQLMPINEVFNIIVNDLGDVDSVQELYDRLKQKADYNPMYWKVFNKFDEIYSNQYIRDENGNIIGINYDNEAFVTQIFNSIKSQRIGFYIVKSDTDSEGNKSTRLIRSQFIQDALVIPSNWNQNMLNGVVNIFDSIKDEEGKYRFKEGGKNNLSHIISVLQDIRNNIGKLGDTEFKIDDETYRLDKVEDVIRIKEKTIQMLNALGIMISKEMLDYKLFTQYQGNDQHALNLWLKSQGTDSFNAFLNILSNFTRPDGTINQDAVEIGYKNSGFVKDLGNWQGKYNSVTTQSMSLAFDGKKVYNISQNHTISHITNQLNKSVGIEEKTQYVKTLMNFSYNQNSGEGSILLKAIQNSATAQFKLGTYIGFKTDTPGDVGSEFKSEPEIEDYMAKLTMLQQGCMIFPTLADKGTWTFLELLGDSNVRIPGMTYGKVPIYNDKNEEIGERNTVFNRPSVRKYFDKDGNKKYYLKPDNSVLDQFLEYARCECLAIQQCMEDLGYEEIHGYTKTGRTILKEEQKIKNYHTGKLPNGTRFLSLTKLLVPTMKGDQKKLIQINLNDPNKSSNEMLKLAYKHLFDKSIDEQREIIAATLHIQNELAMKKAVQLGLIEKKGEHYYNKHLNQTQINTLYNEFYNGFKNAFKANNITKYSIDEDLCRDLAIQALLGDVTNRSIMSSEECERCFSGHPGMFKVKYDYKKGVIKDSTSDKQKRIGGMVSTGDDNRRDMPGIPETYVCAECEDYEVQSTAKIYGRIKGLFHDSQLREAYGNYMQQAIITEHKQDGYNEHDLSEQDREEYDKNLSEVWDDAYNLSIDEIKSKLPKEIVDKAERLAAAFASAYDEGINVADGAAYITEDMCANLLRKRGAFTQDVKEAFEILKDKSNPWIEQYEAYKKIFEATTLVTTKYTAYGMRPQNWIDENGNYQQTDIAVPYYNKFALFPLFDCIATGKMRGIYDKMRNEGVDMLLMTSAIKIGSQGSVSFNGEQIEGTFNKYEQNYDFLRRQLNTDPEEEHAIAMGTQMVKIALSNLRLYRNNYKVGDKTMTGEQIRDEFMKHIIELSKIGVDKFRQRFYDKEGRLDPVKIAEYLKKQLTDRNANRSIIEAIELIDNPGVPGSKKQASPLAATTSAAWIESIMISAANKDIVDIITPGNSFVQRSVFAIEGEDGEGNIEGKEYYNGKRLEMINDKGSMDAVISIDYFEDILPEGLSFKEQRDFLIKHNIIGENAESNTIGYRIPTQAQSSIHALRFLDVVPAVKSTIILPQEFTKITGSDGHSFKVRTSII